MVKMISIKNECWGTRRVFVMVEKKKKKKQMHSWIILIQMGSG